MYKFYLQWVYDKLFSLRFLKENSKLVFQLQLSQFWLQLGSRCILGRKVSISSTWGSRSICCMNSRGILSSKGSHGILSSKGSHGILSSKGSRGTCCMGSRNILMGRSMGHGEVRSLILRVFKIRGELEVSRIL